MVSYYYDHAPTPLSVLTLAINAQPKSPTMNVKCLTIHFLNFIVTSCSYTFDFLR